VTFAASTTISAAVIQRLRIREIRAALRGPGRRSPTNRPPRTTRQSAAPPTPSTTANPASTARSRTARNDNHAAPVLIAPVRTSMDAVSTPRMTAAPVVSAPSDPPPARPASADSAGVPVTAADAVGRRPSGRPASAAGVTPSAPLDRTSAAVSVASPPAIRLHVPAGRLPGVTARRRKLSSAGRDDLPSVWTIVSDS
jgi:hypothetical protein